MADSGKAKLVHKIAPMILKTLYVGLMEKIIQPAQQVSAEAKLQHVQLKLLTKHLQEKMISY